MLILTCAQVREIDRLAIEEMGLPGIVLMENAARNAAVAIVDLLEGELQLVASDAKVAICCGGGNNGGDGYAVARYLHNAGAQVCILAASDPSRLTGDAAINARVAQNMGLDIRPAFTAAQMQLESPVLGDVHLIVDALLGTGFAGPVRAPLDGLIESCNQARQQGAKVVALDVPSGLDADTGEAGGPAVEADLTVTFVAHKPGLRIDEGRAAVDEQGNPVHAYAGQVVVADIGVPVELIRRVAGG